MLLRLLLAPVLVGFASLAARRWGDRVGGWIAAGFCLSLVAALAVQGASLALDPGTRSSSKQV